MKRQHVKTVNEFLNEGELKTDPKCYVNCSDMNVLREFSSFVSNMTNYSEVKRVEGKLDPEYLDNIGTTYIDILFNSGQNISIKTDWEKLEYCKIWDKESGKTYQIDKTLFWDIFSDYENIIDGIMAVYLDWKNLNNDTVKFLERFVDGKYKWNDKTMSWDVDGDVFIDNVKLDGKIPIKFGVVTGDFNCENLDLKTLENCPTEVGNNFYCGSNKLTTLVGGPLKAKYYDCCYNQLKDLIGAPKEVDKLFRCSSNNLYTLKGGPVKVGTFDCSDNNLETLSWAPKIVNIHFYCKNNRYLTLKKQANITLQGNFYYYGTNIASDDVYNFIKGHPRPVVSDYE